MTPAGGTTTAATPLQPQRPGLGRQYLPDVRDRAYTLTPKRLTQLQKIAGVTKQPRTLPWHIGEIVDQGNTSQCVVHAYMAFIEAAPIFKRALGWDTGLRTRLYTRAQQIDGFPMPHDGTTARAMLEVARAENWIAEYLWVNDEDLAREYLLTRGGLMAGTDWFDGMFTPSAKGAYVDPSGNVAGGHEYFVRWYYGPKHRKYPDSYEFQQSWGEWGDKGLFRMKADVFKYLVWQLNGDLVSPIEQPVVRPEVAA
jgi:hypothetical protein